MLISKVLSTVSTSTQKEESKVIKAIIELLDDMAMSVSDLEEGLDVVSDQVDEIDEDLSDLEGYVYEDDDDCCGDDDCYEIECPNCGETICVDDGILEDGSIDCPNCGTLLEFDFDDDCCCGDDDCDCDHDD